MKRFHRVLFAALILLRGFQLEAQQNLLHAYIPADAKTVIDINLPSLSAKMTWEEIQQLSWFSEALKDAPDEVKGFLKDPSAFGIDFKSNLYVVLIADKENKTKPRPVVYGLIRDTARFAATVQQISPKQKTRKTGNMQVWADNTSAIAWTNNVFVASLGGRKKAGDSMEEKTAIADKQMQVNQMIDRCRTLLSMPAQSLAKNEQFIALAKEDGDIRFWINRSQSTPKTKGAQQKMFEMMNWGMMQENGNMAATIRFEQGKAVMNMKTYMNKTLDSLYRLYPGKPINTAILKKLPAGQPIALLSFGLSAEMLKAIMKMMGTEKMLDSLAKKSPVNPMDIADGLNGDLTLAVIRADEIDEKDSVAQALHGIQFFLAASVKNKSKIEPLVKMIQQPKDKPADGEGKKPSGPLGNFKPTILLNDEYLVLSASSFAAEKFLASTGGDGIFPAMQPYANSTSLFSIDLKTVFTLASQLNKKGGPEGLQEIINTFDRVVFYGSGYENGAARGTGELQLSDKNENSLKQLMALVDVFYQMEKNKRPKTSYQDIEEPKLEEDKAKASTAPPPPPKKTDKAKKK